MAHQHHAQDNQIDLRVAHLITNYGPEALNVAREHIQQYRTVKNWRKEQEWLSLYSQILEMPELSFFNY